MPDPIKRMIRKRQRNAKLNPYLHKQRQRTKPRCQARRPQMPPEQRRNQIGSPEYVKPTREQQPRDSGQDGPVPRDLRPVDGEMGGYGSSETLGGENGIWSGGGSRGWFAGACGSGFGGLHTGREVSGLGREMVWKWGREGGGKEKRYRD